MHISLGMRSVSLNTVLSHRVLEDLAQFKDVAESIPHFKVRQHFI